MASAAREDRFPLFDGLRALAALSVLAFHAGLYTRADQGHTLLATLAARLNVGVAIFFVISGFLLYRPFVAARAAGAAAPSVAGYGLRRVLRIVPAYWVALTLLARYPGLPDIPGAHSWIYYGFLQDYDHTTVDGGIGPAWSLGCEAVFYLALPFLSLVFGWVAARRGRGVWWQFELAALALLTALGVLYMLDATRIAGSAPPRTFATTFGWFALGMALAIASVLARGRAAAIARRSWLGWPLAAAAFLMLARGIGIDSSGGFAPGAQTQVQDFAIYALSGIVGGGVVLPAVFTPASRTRISTVLAWRPLAWLGVVSYGIYLYHVPIVVKLNGDRVTNGGNAPLRFAEIALGSAVVAAAVAAISYYAIERPAMRWRPRRSRRAAREHQALAHASTLARRG